MRKLLCAILMLSTTLMMAQTTITGTITDQASGEPIPGANVKVGCGTVLKSHVVVEGHTTIGENNTFHEFCSIGVAPQDKSYKNEPTQTIIGNNNLFIDKLKIQ